MKPDERVGLTDREEPALPAGDPGRSTEHAQTIPGQRVHDFVEAMRVPDWTTLDWDQELALLRFSIDRVLAIAEALERDLEPHDREHAVTLVSVLVGAAERAARQLVDKGVAS